MDVQNIQWVLKFVRNFHPPIVPRCQFPVDALKYLPRCHRGFLPSGVLVRQLLAYIVDLLTFMRDVEKVPRHEIPSTYQDVSAGCLCWLTFFWRLWSLGGGPFDQLSGGVGLAGFLEQSGLLSAWLKFGGFLAGFFGE
jgi:hypothetical protein